MERLTQIERAGRQLEKVERQKAELAGEVERHRVAEMDAQSKVAMLEARLREQEKEMDSLLASNNNQRKNTVHVLENLLETQRAAHAEANRAEALSVQLQVTQGKLDQVSQEVSALKFNERTANSKLRTISHGKHARTDDYYEMGFDSVHGTDGDDQVPRGNKRFKSTTSPLKFSTPEDGGFTFKGKEQTNSQQTNTEDYTKFTVQKLRQELTKHNFGAKLLQLKNPNKKDILAPYEKCVLQKS